ncbi:MAG: DUF3108 domain-containing protein [Pyrinomonadaceae bacterium]|nr:DUF3108 domain-containing protein [Pyrinomonadaceae bacterium]
MKKKLVILLFLLVFGVSFAHSQTTSKLNPYIDGEVMNYEGNLNKLVFRGISVANLTFTTSKAENGKDYLVKAEAISKGTLLKLFRFSFLYRVTSTIDSERFVALKTVKRDEQGDRVRDSEANFDYTEKKVTYVETDPKDSARPPRRIASAIEDETHDLISGIYILRSMPLAVGNSFALNISDSGLVYKVPVNITKKEMQNTIFGKVMCFRIEPQVFGKGRMIESDGSMIIWITDDNRRLPVRANLNTSIGKVDVKLKKYEIKR